MSELFITTRRRGFPPSLALPNDSDDPREMSLYGQTTDIMPLVLLLERSLLLSSATVWSRVECSGSLVVPEGYQRIILLLLVKPSSVKTNLIPEQQQRKNYPTMNTNVISLVWRGGGSGSNCNLDREQGRRRSGRGRNSRLVVGLWKRTARSTEGHRGSSSSSFSFVREVKW